MRRGFGVQNKSTLSQLAFTSAVIIQKITWCGEMPALHQLVPDFDTTTENASALEAAVKLLRASISKELNQHSDRTDRGWQIGELESVEDSERSLEANLLLLGDRVA